MPQFVIVMDAHAMDDFRPEEIPAIGRAAHAVCQEAIDAGVWVCGSGLETQRASVVSAGGAVTKGPPVAVGGLIVLELPSWHEAHKWAAKWATACRCNQEVWQLGPDPEIDAMLRQAAY